jgi:hypothetical protein
MTPTKQNTNDGVLQGVAAQSPGLKKQQDFLRSVDQAFAAIKDPVAFSLGREKINITYGDRKLALDADQLARFAGDMKGQTAEVKHKISAHLQGLNKKPELKQSTEARLYNTQRSKNLGSVDMENAQEYVNHAILPTHKEDFKGDYVQCMKNIHDMSNDPHIKASTKKNILHYIGHQADFDETFEAVKKPPVEMNAAEKIDTLEWADRRLGSGSEITPAETRGKRAQMIDYVLNNRELAQGSEPLLNSLVHNQAESMRGAFADSLTKMVDRDGLTYVIPDDSAEDVSVKQGAYLKEMKGMIGQMQSRPDLQETFAQQLVQNTPHLQNAEMRKDARDFIQKACPDSMAAQAAKKQQAGFEEKFQQFGDNTENLLRAKPVMQKLIAPAPAGMGQ